MVILFTVLTKDFCSLEEALPYFHGAQLAVVYLAKTDTHGPKFRHEYMVAMICMEDGTKGVEPFGVDVCTCTLPFANTIPENASPDRHNHFG